ncbi:tail protein X [Marinobacter adhaerens]|uniref:Tail protein X n=2 Tax=Marinobacter adhaerens TaxID=1033846 RepID=A0ABX8INM9_9GAMM|nr:tail protein X [Marinobacter adhaerens]ADP96413.1 phage tail protein X [Marinobacter adhaerens HP15]QWV14403.1 tail protein X [Marinobacter adhaerens]
MALKYNTKAGDTVDFVVWKHYGRQDGQIVETIFSENPGLADYGPTLPAGIEIKLPPVPEPEQQQGVRLWD